MNINNLFKAIFVNYNKEGFFQITILLENEKGIIPFYYGKTDFISLYPYLSKQLMDGKTLYVDSHYGYLGIEHSEGPYCETKVFESQYEEKNIDFNELLIKINENIKNNKNFPRKLIKIGTNYEQYY